MSNKMDIITCDPSKNDGKWTVIVKEVTSAKIHTTEGCSTYYEAKAAGDLLSRRVSAERKPTYPPMGEPVPAVTAASCIKEILVGVGRWQAQVNGRTGERRTLYSDAVQDAKRMLAESGESVSSEGHVPGVGFSEAENLRVAEAMAQLEDAKADRDRKEEELQAIANALGCPRSEIQDKVSASMGVGNGSRCLFVYGDIESIMAAQALILRTDAPLSHAQRLEIDLEHEERWRGLISGALERMGVEFVPVTAADGLIVLSRLAEKLKGVNSTLCKEKRALGDRVSNLMTAASMTAGALVAMCNALPRPSD